MTNLADHWDDSSYLPEGWHNVAVSGFKLLDREPPGVKFTVCDFDTGKMVETEAFWLRNAPGKEGAASPLFALTGFAKACGLTREEARGYEPDNPNSHAMLVGRKVRVLVTLEKGKYHRATEWASIGSTTPVSAPAPPATAPDPAVQSSTPLPDTPGFKPEPISGPEVPF